MLVSRHCCCSTAAADAASCARSLARSLALPACPLPCNSNRALRRQQARAPLQQQRQHLARLPSYVPCASSTPEETSTSGREPDEVYMKEYAQLKNDLIGGTRKSGAVLAAYLLFTVDAEAALAALAGVAACNGYMGWLCKDVDNVKPTDRVPMWEAEEIEDEKERNFRKVLAAYQHALKPRLLVLVGLAALSWVGTHSVSVSPEGVEQPLLDPLHQGCMLLGFLSYKVPLYSRILDTNTPKAYDETSGRPVIAKVEDTLDKWGRPKKENVRMPTEALPEEDRGSLPQVEVGQELSADAKVTEGIVQSIRRATMSVLPFTRDAQQKKADEMQEQQERK